MSVRFAGFYAWALFVYLAVSLPASAESSGIAWYPGSVAEAFTAARTTKKPVFLYWGAKWCPPCQQLQSSVFVRSDFIEKSREFVAVHLDGDDHGAQKWGETFHVVGYPTVLILRPDQQEVMRLSGGLDLSQYADSLDIALRDLKPIRAVLSAVDESPSKLTTADCQRLAYNGWFLEDYEKPAKQAAARSLQHAAAACPGLSAVDRARLQIDSALLDDSPTATDEIIAILKDPELSVHLAGALRLLQWDPEFLTAVAAHGNPIAANFLASWNKIMEDAANDPQIPDAEQLNAVRARLAAAKAFDQDHKIPQALAADARSRVQRALDKRYEAYARTGVVNSAAGIYDALDDDDGMYVLLTTEMAQSKTPYYYMQDLGELEEKRGHAQEALQWYARAYDSSLGIATRYQWGSAYLQALLRVTPMDHERIRTVAVAVIGELDGPDRLHGRASMGLKKLDTKLRKWNAEHRYDADIRAMQQRMQGVCSKIPPNDSSRKSCERFLS